MKTTETAKDTALARCRRNQKSTNGRCVLHFHQKIRKISCVEYQHAHRTVTEEHLERLAIEARNVYRVHDGRRPSSQ